MVGGTRTANLVETFTGLTNHLSQEMCVLQLLPVREAHRHAHEIEQKTIAVVALAHFQRDVAPQRPHLVVGEIVHPGDNSMQVRVVGPPRSAVLADEQVGTSLVELAAAESVDGALGVGVEVVPVVHAEPKPVVDPQPLRLPQLHLQRVHPGGNAALQVLPVSPVADVAEQRTALVAVDQIFHPGLV